MKRRDAAGTIKYLFAGFLLFSALVMAYTVFGAAESNMNTSEFLYALGRACGLIGFVLLSSIIISGDFARLFDRYFGLDRIINFHKRYSLAVAVFVIAHPAFFMLSFGNVSDYIIPRTGAISLSIGILAFYAFIVVEVSSRIAKMISYFRWQLLHVLIYILFVLVLYHSVVGGSDTKEPQVAAIFAVLALGVVIGSVYRAFYKLKQRNKRYIVEGVKWETRDAFTLILKPSEKMSFKPGQFCFLRINKENLHARHPFSMANAPGDEFLEFTIKLKGRFTKVASELKKGEEIAVEGPFGKFTVEEDGKRPVFVAFGVGITPFMSMIRDAAKRNSRLDATMLYASKSYGDMIFRDEILRAKIEGFEKFIVVDKGELHPGIISGRVDSEMLKGCIKEPKGCVFYVCGSEGVKDSMRKALGRIGVSQADIIDEEFFW